MKLEELFAKVLGDPVATFSDDSTPDTVRSWDSLRHIELVIAAEAAYGVAFAIAEVTTIRSLGSMRALLLDKGVDA